MAQATCSTLPSNASSRTHRLAVTAWVLHDAVLFTAKKKHGDFWDASLNATASARPSSSVFPSKRAFHALKLGLPIASEKHGTYRQ